MSKVQTYDSKTAVSYVGYDLANTDIVVGTPSPFGDLIQQWGNSKAKNAFGESGTVHSLQNSKSEFHSVVSKAVSEKRTLSIFIDSKELISTIPTLSKLVSDRSPSVIHSILNGSDSSDAMAVRQTGVAIILSNSVQEAQDLALISHIVSLRASLPVLHVFNNSERSQIQSIRFNELSSLCEKQRALTTNYKSTIEDASAPLFLRSPTGGIDVNNVVTHIADVFSDINNELSDRKYSFFEYSGVLDATSVLVINGITSKAVDEYIKKLSSQGHKVGVLRVRVYRPWSDAQFIQALPKTTKKIAVLEFSNNLTTAWGPLFLDVASSFHSGLWNGEAPIIRETRVNINAASTISSQNLDSVLSKLDSAGNGIIQIDVNGEQSTVSEGAQSISLTDQVDLDVEGPYLKMLEQLFKERLVAANVSENSSLVSSDNKGSAEYGFGFHIAQIQKYGRFVDSVSILANSGLASPALTENLKIWLLHHKDAQKSSKYGEKIIELLEKEKDSHVTIKNAYELKSNFSKPARWLIGGDRIWYDLGSSGVHHVISAKENVNILVLDTQPYSQKLKDTDRRKKDIGLYAMTYGGVYVASVAVHQSYAQVLRALTEAESFDGPSVVLAYAPRIDLQNKPSHVSKPLAVLKETKLAVDSGYWPLYRWNPSLNEPFALDSEKVKSELKQFLERENHFAMVLKAHPLMAHEYTASADTELKANLENKVQDSYNQLLSSLNSKPLLVLYGSDGTNGPKLAKRITAEAKQRGLRSKIAVLNAKSLEDLQHEENVLFIVSTAGQGEFPSNAKDLWKSIASATKETAQLQKLNFAVFALGDKHYWPLPEDAHYFAKPGKDLHTKLESLASPLTHLGIGDDQDADGHLTGYNAWAGSFWKSLGVDNVEVKMEAYAPSDDAIKYASNFLRGSIAEGLLDTSTGALAEFDTKLTKFHGIYQQDDRDVRSERSLQNLEPAYSFMIRVRVPGGVSTPAQWLAMDAISDTHANGTIKLTTRQAFQFHGIIKSKLKKSMQDIIQSLMDTIAACGDVNRNVMCNPNPDLSHIHAEVLEFTKALSDHLTPRTSAYHEIWLDKKLVSSTDVDEEPIYGKTYLPRKFKVAVAVPPSNDVDVFAHCLGYIAIVENNKLVGFNVTVGGGMGMTHGNKKTYPRLAEVMCFCSVSEAVEIGEKVVLVQRDYGDRTNRKHARLKYTIDDRGLEWFKGQVEERLGRKLQPPRPYKFTTNGDIYGWTQNAKGNWNYTMFISSGRVKDTPSIQYKTGLAEIAKVLTGEFRLTPNQHLMIADISPQQKSQISLMLQKYGIENGNLSGLRKHSMACVALPTCALAMAESERYLPDLITKMETLLEESGLRDDAITIRMTGCPNGCARPQIAEIGFVGKAPGAYNMYLGGGFSGERLSKLFKEAIGEEEILKELAPIIKRYALERKQGEHFGDFVIRAGYVKETILGSDFHA